MLKLKEAGHQSGVSRSVWSRAGGALSVLMLSGALLTLPGDSASAQSSSGLIFRHYYFDQGMTHWSNYPNNTFSHRLLRALESRNWRVADFLLRPYLKEEFEEEPGFDPSAWQAYARVSLYLRNYRTAKSAASRILGWDPENVDMLGVIVHSYLLESQNYTTASLYVDKLKNICKFCEVTLLAESRVEEVRFFDRGLNR